MSGSFFRFELPFRAGWSAALKDHLDTPANDDLALPAALPLTTLVLVALAIFAFRRRDLGS